MFRMKADSKLAVERFITRVVKFETVCFLDDDGYVAGCDAIESDRFVCPVFSDKAYATRGARCWENQFQVVSLDLKTYMDQLLVSDIEEDRLVGPNWDGNMAGAEVEPRELLLRLKDELEQQSLNKKCN